MHIFEKLRNVLLQVTPKVFYGTNEYDNEGVEKAPFIVYHAVNKRAPVHADDKPVFYNNQVQVTLVTDKKDVELESLLETTLLSNGYNFEVTTEYHNSDRSLCRVYELNLEENSNGK